MYPSPPSLPFYMSIIYTIIYYPDTHKVLIAYASSKKFTLNQVNFFYTLFFLLSKIPANKKCYIQNNCNSSCQSHFNHTLLFINFSLIKSYVESHKTKFIIFNIIVIQGVNHILTVYFFKIN